MFNNSTISHALHILEEVGSPHLSHSYNLGIESSTSKDFINEDKIFSLIPGFLFSTSVLHNPSGSIYFSGLGA